jgi:hypothetical protein
MRALLCEGLDQGAATQLGELTWGRGVEKQPRRSVAISEYPAEYVHELRREADHHREVIERAITALEQILRDLRLALVAQQQPEAKD